MNPPLEKKQSLLQNWTFFVKYGSGTYKIDQNASFDANKLFAVLKKISKKKIFFHVPSP